MVVRSVDAESERDAINTEGRAVASKTNGYLGMLPTSVGGTWQQGRVVIRGWTSINRKYRFTVLTTRGAVAVG